jgi:uncharacterized membrane protein
MIHKKGYQVLKIIHIYFASLWLGAGVIIGILLATITGENIIKNIEVSYFIDVYVVIPCVFICLTTGILFSIFTKWGFIKHGWITIKYILNLAPPIMGIIFHGSQFQKLVKMANELGANALFNSEFKSLFNIFYVVCVLNGVIILTAYILSVVKPNFKNNIKTVEVN